MADLLDQGRLALGVGNVEAAYQIVLAAVGSEPGDDAWRLLGQLLYGWKKYEAAAAAFGRIGDRGYEDWVNWGWNLHMAGRGEEGLPLLEGGVSGCPAGAALPWTNLSQCRLRLGDVGGAVTASAVAVARSGDPVHGVARAMALFAAERWGEGFAAYEARVAFKMPQMLSYPYPRWDGRGVGDLFVQAEMGLGDALWMLRYLPEVCRRVDRVIFYVHKELRRLVEVWAGRLGIENLVVSAMPRELPRADAWCPMLSLPVALDVEWIMGPMGGSYLLLPQPFRGNPGLVVDRPGMQVGIAWAGSPENEEAVWKDIPLAVFMPVVEMPGVEVHGLQVGRPADIGVLGLHGVVRDRSSELGDMLDAAMVISTLDVVVCNDSALAHLAGAMGKSVIMVRNARAAPWIWPMAGETTPWYDSITIECRARGEDWGAPMRRVVERLNVIKGAGDG